MKRTFTYEEAAALLPEVQRLTEAAVAELEALEAEEGTADEEGFAARNQEVVARWAAAMIHLGLEVKGLWLIDFDSGSGYYCWKYPEPGLQFFHSYEEGFGGRVSLN